VVFAPRAGGAGMLAAASGVAAAQPDGEIGPGEKPNDARLGVAGGGPRPGAAGSGSIGSGAGRPGSSAGVPFRPANQLPPASLPPSGNEFTAGGRRNGVRPSSRRSRSAALSRLAQWAPDVDGRSATATSDEPRGSTASSAAELST
jgi:hypothetical protein